MSKNTQNAQYFKNIVHFYICFCEKLPIEYTLDKELISLISEANLKYREYKSNLKNSQFDSKFFLILIHYALAKTIMVCKGKYMFKIFIYSNDF